MTADPKDRTLGEQVVERLKAGERSVDVRGGGVRARVDAAGAGPYGAEIERVRVEAEGTRSGDAGERMSRAVEQITERVRYLPEELRPIELDQGSARGILRTRRDQVRGGEYYEVEVKGGEQVDVRRFKWDREKGKRKAVADNFGHGVLRRLLDDLGEIVGE